MNQLPIQKLTLYKQVIGYFERKEKFDGSTLPLIIPRDNINDTFLAQWLDPTRGESDAGLRQIKGNFSSTGFKRGRSISEMLTPMR